MVENSFRYKSSDGIININTLSPSKSYYYIVRPPEELNKAAFGCKIAFYTIDKKLLYYRKKTYSHELHNKKEIASYREIMEAGKSFRNVLPPKMEIVLWSGKGNVAYMLEHYRGNYDELYESVFLNLRELYCYRIDEIRDNFKIVDGLELKDREYDEEEVIKKLEELGLAKQPLIKDNIPKRSLLDNVLNTNKWYPAL